MAPITKPVTLPDDVWTIGEGVAGGGAREDEGDGAMEVTESADTENMGVENKSCDMAGVQSDENMEESGQLEEEVVLKIVHCLEELYQCLRKAHHTIVSQLILYLLCKYL